MKALDVAIELVGNWNKGFAYDVHTLDSIYLGVNENGRDCWKNTRSEMGSLIYELKYKHKKENVLKIVDLITARIKGLESFDFIIPIPPSNKNRPFQPVYEIAEELGRRVKVKVGYALVKTQSAEEIKNIQDLEKRKEQLEQSMKITGHYCLSGKRILLLDDLYRSGITLEVATNLLKNRAKADTINVLTMTKTRSNK